MNVVSKEARSMASAPSNASIDQRTKRTPAGERHSGRPQPLIDALVPDAHLNAAVAGIRGLGLGGMRVMAVGPTWTSPGLWSRHTAARAVAPSVVSAPQALAERIARLAADHGPLVVYPSREETINLMLSARSWGGVVMPFPSMEVLQQVRDKSRLEQTGANAGLLTPASLFEGSAAELAGQRFRWPVVVKPAQPVSAFKTARLAADEDELRRLLHQPAVLDRRAATHAVVLPLGLHLQLGEVARRARESGKRNSLARRKVVFEHTFGVVLGVFLGVLFAHHQPAQALAKIGEPSRAGNTYDRGEHQPSYLNDSESRVRNWTIWPPSSSLTSSLVTSAILRSRSVLEAVLTALRAASSQELALVPMTSVMR